MCSADHTNAHYFSNQIILILVSNLTIDSFGYNIFLDNYLNRMLIKINILTEIFGFKEKATSTQHLSYCLTTCIPDKYDGLERGPRISAALTKCANLKYQNYLAVGITFWA